MRIVNRMGFNNEGAKNSEVLIRKEKGRCPGIRWGVNLVNPKKTSLEDARRLREFF